MASSASKGPISLLTAYLKNSWLQEQLLIGRKLTKPLLFKLGKARIRNKGNSRCVSIFSSGRVQYFMWFECIKDSLFFGRESTSPPTED